MKPEPRLHPYSWPVQLRRSDDYLSLHPRHTSLAIEVVRTPSHPTFRTTTDFAGWEAVGLADFQLQHDQPMAHLGSARAVHFSDHFIKGVGLTPLYPSIPLAYYHGSGHLLPSAAAREYLVTVWARCIGLGAQLVPCEGLLVARMDDELSKISTLIYQDATGDGSGAIPRCDRALRALTVKPGPFLRFSNLKWRLHARMDQSFLPLEGILADWHQEACGLSSPLQNIDDISLLLTEIEKATLSACLSFFGFQKEGILWGSLNNNFTAGIRFLDLEVPLVTEPGVVLDIRQHDEDHVGTHFFRVEVFGILRQFRSWVLELLGWCRTRAMSLELSEAAGLRKARNLMTGIAEELDRVFRQESPLFSDQFWLDTVAGHYVSVHGNRLREKVTRAIHDDLHLRLHGTAEIQSHSECRFTETSYSLELGRHSRLSYPGWIDPDHASRIKGPRHELFSDIIAELEAQQEPEAFLECIRRGEARIKARFGQPSPSV